MPLKFKCTHCNKMITTEFLKVGDEAECKKCGGKTIIQEDAKVTEKSKSKHTTSKKVVDAWEQEQKAETMGKKEIHTDDTNSTNQNVTVTDIDMPFMSMVTFIIKWSLASIPAFIILLLIGLLVMAIFGVGAISLFK